MKILRNELFERKGEGFLSKMSISRFLWEKWKSYEDWTNDYSEIFKFQRKDFSRLRNMVRNPDL